MSKTISFAEQQLASDLLIEEPTGSYGEYDVLLRDGQLDEDIIHPHWKRMAAAQRAGQELLGVEVNTPDNIAAYGYTLYRELAVAAETPAAIYLDPRCFAANTNLADVLAETTKWAVAEDKPKLVVPLVTGMIDTIQHDLEPGNKLRRHLDTVISTDDLEAIKLYADFINSHTLKTDATGQTFLKSMAHAIKTMQPDPNQSGVTHKRVQRQILLEDVGHAWIRKGWPVSQIDWLP